MTLRKKILPNFFLQILVLLAASYIWVQGIDLPAAIQWLFTASGVAIFWYAARHVPFPSLFHWFVLSYVALFYFYPILLPIFDIPFGFDAEVVAGYAFLTVGGIHLFIVSYEMGRRKNQFKDPAVSDHYKVHHKRFQRMLWALVLMNLLGVILIMLDAGSLSYGTIQEMMNSRRDERRLASSGLSLLGSYAIFFGSLGYALLPIYVGKHKWGGILAIGVLILVDVFLIIAYRVRTPVVLHLIAVSVGILYLKHRVAIVRVTPLEGLRRIDSRQLIKKMAVVLFVVGMLGMYVRAVRGYIGNTNDLAFLKQDLTKIIELAIALDSALGGDLGYTPTVFRVIEYVPDRHEYLGGQSYYRLLFTLTPRFVWADKPDNTGLIVGRWFFPGTVVQSNPPGVMGDLYINFGYAGILGFILFGLVFARLDNASSIAYYLAVAASFATIFHFVRGAFTNIVLQFIVLYIAGLIIERYILVRKHES